MDAVETTPPQIVENGLLNGRVRLRQPARGYRAGMDAALLAAAVAPQAGQSVIEAGCGAGAVLMQIAARHPGVRLTGLERDPVMADLAMQNAVLNGVGVLRRAGVIVIWVKFLSLPILIFPSSSAGDVTPSNRPVVIFLSSSAGDVTPPNRPVVRLVGGYD